MFSYRWFIALLAVSTFMSLVFVTDGAGQSPLFETRAVWFATVLRDGNWPSAPDAAGQEAELRDRIRTAKAMGMNVFVFQAVSRGDAMYRSARLPWSWQLRGAGEDPGYDPLAVAVDEAHKLGLELHAWINVFRVGDGETLERYASVTGPEHVAYAHPEWVRDRNGALWLDPSSAEAREWLVGNVLEIVENYDVDAVHYDFIRYPTGGFGDDLASCQFDGGGTCDDVGEWRRDNVTAFVESASEAVNEAKPWVQVGATPIGHYRGPYDWSALLGYSDVFQASREWAASGFVDYLAPQIYWGTGDRGGTPRFEVLADEWVDETQRPVFIGMAPYLVQEASLPPSDITDQIAVTRSVGAAGQMYFRFDHLLANIQYIRPAYGTPALTAPMSHRFAFFNEPSRPDELQIRTVGSSSVELSWQPSTGSPSNPVHAYAVFRREGSEPDTSSAEDLFAVVGATSFTEGGLHEQPAQDIYYRVLAVSKLGSLSAGSNVVSTGAVDLAVASDLLAPSFRILSIYPNPAVTDAVVAFELAHSALVRVRVFDLLGREVASAHAAHLVSGRHEILLNVSSLSAGTYLIEVRADDGRIVRQLVKM